MHHGLSREELEIAMNLRRQGLRFSVLAMDQEQPAGMPSETYRIRMTAVDGTPMIVDAARFGYDGDYVLCEAGKTPTKPHFWDARVIQKLTPARR